MKKFVLKLILFLIPLYLYVICIIIIDPFCYFRIINLSPESQKVKTYQNFKESSTYGNMLWKINDFHHNPCPNIILGDSRTLKMDTALIHSISGEKYYNLAVEGCSVEESSQLFWYAQSKIPLKKVFYTISLRGFGVKERDLFTEARKVLKFPIYMFTDRFFVDLAWKNFKYKLFPKTFPHKRHRNDARTRTIKSSKRLYKLLATYEFSYKNYKMIQDIAQFCSENGIELIFLNLPTYIGYQNLIKELNMEKEKTRFLKAFSNLGPVYHFDYKNYITNNLTNYEDNVHLVKDTYDIICKDIWGSKPKYAKILNKQSSKEYMTGTLDSQ